MASVKNVEKSKTLPFHIHKHPIWSNPTSPEVNSEGNLEGPRPTPEKQCFAISLLSKRDFTHFERDFKIGLAIF